MYECQTCPRTFCTQRACDQHMDDKDHWAQTFECEMCPRVFKSQNAADQHIDALRHWRPKVPCETCRKMFHTQNATDQHMRALGHHRNYCEDCHLPFQNKNNLRIVRFLTYNPSEQNTDTPVSSTSAPKFTTAEIYPALIVAPTTPLPAASPTTLRWVAALVPVNLTVKPSTALFVSVTCMESLQTSRLNGMRRELLNAWLLTMHSTAYSGSVIYATRSSTPRVP